MEVICDKCSFNNKMNISPELEGKKVQFRCKSKDCDHMISVTLKVDSSDRITEIVLPSTTIISGGYLVQENDTNHPSKYELKKGINIIGRKSSSYTPDIAVESSDRYMSRNHCTILQKLNHNGNCEFVLQDYNSSNNTKLNNKLLNKDEELYLVDNDLITMGTTDLVFRINQKTL